MFYLALFLVPLSIAFAAILNSRKHAKTESEKRFVTLFYIVLMSTFAAGAFIRAVQQDRRSQWQNGFVGILMGIFISLWGLPILWHAWHSPHVKYASIKKGLALLISSLAGLTGATIIYSGLYQVLVSAN